MFERRNFVPPLARQCEQLDYGSKVPGRLRRRFDTSLLHATGGAFEGGT
jgi:hypothetical protein